MDYEKNLLVYLSVVRGSCIQPGQWECGGFPVPHSEAVAKLVLYPDLHMREKCCESFTPRSEALPHVLLEKN